MVLAVTIASTDEGSCTVGERAGRFSCLVALAGGLAAFVICEQARSRGELGGLGAIGVAPARAPFGAALGGSVVAALGPALVWAGIADAGALYPRLGPSAGTWEAVGRGVWRQALGNVVVGAAGEVELSAGAAAVHDLASQQPSRFATVAVLLAFAIAVPVWAVAKGRAARRLVVALAAATCSVTLFHLVAVARAPAGLVVVAPLLLLFDAWASSRRGARS